LNQKYLDYDLQLQLFVKLSLITYFCLLNRFN